jgi:F-type H+-transporting ATPase subunit epsilon
MAALGPHAESEARVLEEHDLSAPIGKRFTVTLVTPKGSVVAGDIDEIIAPGVEGEFGVLPGHVAFISALRPGVLTIREGARRDVFAVGPGYLQVGAGGGTRVLVQEAVSGFDVDVTELRAEKANLDEELRKLAGDTGATEAMARLRWVQAQLDAAAASGERPRD